MESIYRFFLNYSSAFFVIETSNREVVICNNAATNMYGIVAKNGEFNSNIFTADTTLDEIISRFIAIGEETIFENITTVANDGSRQISNIMIGYFNENSTEIFIEVTPKIDYRMDIAIDLMNNSLRAEAILELDGFLTIFYANKACFELFDVQDNNFKTLYDVIANTFPPSKKHEIITKVNASLDETNYYYTELQIDTANGGSKWIAIDLQKRVIDSTGEKIVCYMHCIDQHIKTKLERDTVELYFNALQEITGDILFHIDLKTKTFRHSDANAIGFGIAAEIPDFVDNFIETGAVHPDFCEDYRRYTDDLFAGINNYYEIPCAVGVGVFEWFNIKCTYIKNKDGENVEIFGRMHNIQSRKELEIRATHDPMTDVLNKVSFENKVTEILVNSYDKNHALIFIDLDDFKGVNDTLGHAFGDFLLTTVAKRLKRVIREIDFVGRLGGDEFVVFMQSVGDSGNALSRTQLLLDTLRKAFSFDNKTILIKASLGVSIFPKDANNYKDLLEKADQALYKSKDLGKNVVTLYE